MLLNGNSFTNTLQNDLLEKNTKLRTFVASDAELTSIPPAFFPKSIKHIDLSLNELQTVSTDNFGGLLALKSLDLGGNKIESISENAFDDQHNLQTLHLEYNDMETFTKRQFERLINLQYLNVIGNVGADESIFEDLPNINELYI